MDIKNKQMRIDIETKDIKDEPLYTIGTAAGLIGVTVHTLRMYEREGLILPFKKKSSHRLYSDLDIEHLKCIRKALNEKKISIAGIKALFSMIPCWRLRDCPDDHKKACSAYKGVFQPCWTYKHKDNICTENDCRKCIVYRDYAYCDKIKKYLQTIIEDLPQTKRKD